MMADAQLMEEELQQSVMMSERDAEYDEAPADDDIVMGTEVDHNSDRDAEIGSTVEARDQDEDMEDDEGEDHDEGDDEGSDDSEEIDEEDEAQNSDEEESGESSEEDDAFEEDADGDEDDDIPARVRVPQRQRRTRSLDQVHDEDDEDEEGVGAVKIRPGETDDEDDSDQSAASDQASSDAESEASGGWDEAADNGEAGDDDDDEENTNGNNCIFCKQDEENDPAEEFELFLCCSRCADNAHQQCAREAGALTAAMSPDNWRCPDCVGEDSDDGADSEGEEADVNGILTTDATPATRRSAAPKLARDLLPSQKGVIKPDSHSMFGELILGGDPLDGSRVLRKRKTSSVEVEDGAMSLRKRRRNTADTSNDGAEEREESTRPVSARSLRIKSTQHATIQKSTRDSLVVQMRVNATKLLEIVTGEPRPRGSRRRANRTAGARTARGRNGRPARPDAVAALANAVTPFTGLPSQPFFSLYDKEGDELKGKPYGGILTEAEADTSKTLPTNEDRRLFNDAKQKAEEEWRQRLMKMQAAMEVPQTNRRSKKTSGPASQIECIEFGGWEIDTWYAAPYPEEYSRNRVLYICEFCLKYMNSDYVAWRHKLKCPAKHPPGDEIYRDGSMSFFEVDGRRNPVYCQNLCLLAKLFLGSKTLYYDVEPFLFYVLCEYDDLGYHFVGYFSKEKRASSQNNVSCILTLPIHQRKGFGNLLIDFSYLLTRVEQKTGSPEKPLSDMGLVSYRSYWRLVMCKYLLNYISDDEGERKGLSIKTISDDTGMTPDDVISALEGLRCLVRDPQTQLFAFRVDKEYCREYVAKWEAKNYVQLNPAALTWTPYVMGKGNATNFELGPAINAIAPREDVEEQKPDVLVADVLVTDVLVNGDASQSQPEPALDEPAIKGESAVLLSTETETAPVEQVESNGVVPKTEDGDKPNGILVNGDSADHDAAPTLGPKPENDTNLEAEQPERKEGPENWREQYKDVPPTRFEVVPPLAGTRRADRVRLTVPRPPVVRTASAPRPRPRRPGGGSRRTTSSSKPRTASKRKSGGTGRGPGRWPKGTKKSDYGNADSGPGLPPGWVAKNPENPDTKDDNDTVEVQTPGVVKETKSQRGSESSSGKRTGSIREDSTAGKGRPSPRSQSSRDVVMEDAGNEEDGEGEEDTDA
ncbi:hypothetical protein V8F06_000424 [Rhypophila decipiens]